MDILFFNVYIMLIVLPMSTRVGAQECAPLDCIISEWTEWSSCTQTCGDIGTRERTRIKLREESCGGICESPTTEQESCNHKCCPKDCVFSRWSKWALCYCSEEACEGAGERYNCRRTRWKQENATCGGYCDEMVTQLACGHLCCYTDCALGPWGFWSHCKGQCEQRGYEERSRDVIQEAHCGGKECLSTIEEAVCMGECCPVDCKLGEWSTWSKCNTTCGESIETRTRFVQLPACDGLLCDENETTDDKQSRPCSKYINTDCVLSPWSRWTECELANGYCGEGLKTRSRSIVTPVKCQGTACGDEQEVAVCYGTCCRQDCVVSDWTDWGHCSTSCGQGISNRTRAIITAPSCGGSQCPLQRLLTRDCVVTDVVDCAFTDWSPWTTCSSDCGIGHKTHTRILTTPPYCGGKCDNQLTFEETECESYTANQNCEVSEWIEWGECVRNCEKGLRHRNKTVLVNPVCHGELCLGLTESGPCHAECEHYCNIGVCSCKPGYRLTSDLVTCEPFSCPVPKLKYCPPDHTVIVDCRYPYFNCDGYKYNNTCAPYCSPGGWYVKGSPQEIRCTEEGEWTQPDIYCARPNQPPVDISIDVTEIEENRPADYCFGYLSTRTVGEMYERHIYTILDDITGRFYLKDNRVCLTRQADYEEPPNIWTVSFRSTDIEGEYIDKMFTFTVLNANDPPTAVMVQPSAIPENSPAGTVVGCLTGTDDDPGQTVTFALVDAEDKTFATFIQDGIPCIKVIKESDPLCSTDGGTYCILNKEEREVHYITVIATDDGIPTMSGYYDVPITLLDVNDRQTAVQIQPDMIPEQLPAGEPLLKLLTVDEDTGQTYTYTLIQDAGGVFTVEGDSLVASRVFDYEVDVGTQYIIEVQSTDDTDSALKVTSVITMEVEDINEAPFDLQLSSLNGFYMFDINKPELKENIKTAMLGTISVKDVDKGDNIEITFAPGGDADGRLTLFSQRCDTLSAINVYCTARVILLGGLNFETEPQVNVTIQATDTAGEVATLEVILKVIDDNDPPKSLLLNGDDTLTITVDENLRDFTMATMTTVDEDVTDGHTFELTDSAGGMFVLQGNMLKTSTTSTLNYERQSEYTIQVKVTDDGSPVAFTIFEVKVMVQDVNEGPTSTSLSMNTIKENSADNTLVGELTTKDPDNLLEDKQTVTYALPDDSNGRFKIDGNKLLVKQSNHLCGTKPCVLDYEMEPKLTITVLTMDSGHPRLTRHDTFTIQLENVNDSPSDIKISGFTVLENAEIGTYIGDLTAHDQDVGQSVSLSLLDNTDIFGLDGGYKLVTKGVLNYEWLKSYRITVAAIDDGTPSQQGTTELTIRVLNVNEKPTFTNVTSPILLHEDSDIDVPLVTFHISDPDSGDIITVSVQDETSTFVFNDPICNTTPQTGATDCTVSLKLTGPLHVEVKTSYSVTIMVQDTQGLSSTDDIILNVEDKNDPPTDIIFDGYPKSRLTVKENSQGLVIAMLDTVDKDNRQTYTYILVTDTTGYLEIVDNMLKAKASADIDFETQGNENHTITINVTDSGTPPLTFQKTVAIDIEDMNEKPTSAIVKPSDLPENSGRGTIVGTFTVSDPDNVVDIIQTFNLTLLDTARNIFTVQDNVLKVVASNTDCLTVGGSTCKLNHETTPLYTLHLSVTDTGSPPCTAYFDVIVHVTDVNEPPRKVQITENKVHSGSSSGTSIGRLSVDDEDVDQSYIYTLLGDTGVFGVTGEGDVTVVDGSTLMEGDIIQLQISVTDDWTDPIVFETTVKLVVIGDASVTFTVTSEGSPLTFDDNQVAVEENSLENTTVATVIASYPGTGHTIVITVVDGGQYIDVKDVVCGDEESNSVCRGVLYSRTPVDYETTDHFEVVLQAVVDNDPTFNDHFTVTVRNVNESPTDIEFSIPEMSVQEKSQDEVLGLFHSVDPDYGDVDVFSIQDNTYFTISTDGQLRTARDAAIDYESTPTLSIDITVTDPGGLMYTKTFTVNVTDVNEKPTGLTLSNNKIDEMSFTGHAVGELLGTDPDVRQTLTYQLLSSYDNRFAIIGNSLMVSDEGAKCEELGGSNCLLDYESRSTYNLSVRVTDSDIHQLAEVFSVLVNVVDINDSPRAITVSSSKVTEDAVIGTGTTVAKLSAVDDDVGQTLVFTMVGGGVFTVEGDTIVLASLLDYETQTSHEIVIEAKDDGTPSASATATFTIEVLDINEAPTRITIVSTADSPTLFPEGSPRVGENLPSATYIGQVVILDDDTVDEISAQILATDVQLYNTECIPVAKGTRCTMDLRSSRIYDYEVESVIMFDIVATDKGGLQLSHSVKLEIDNANDPPTEIYFDGESVTFLSIRENDQDVLLSTLTVLDEETDQTYTYGITDDSKTLYFINNELRVTSAADLDFEETEEFTVTIRATDSGTPPMYMDKEMKIKITDINESPTDLHLTDNKVPETAAVDYRIGSLVVHDPDNAHTDIQTFTFQLMDTTGTSPFKLQGDTLLVSQSEFDYEKKNEYLIQIQVTDSGQPQLSTTFGLQLDIVDVNDPPVLLTFSGTKITENAAIGTLIGQLSSRDDDISQSLVYSLAEDSFLSIHGADVVVNGLINFETSSQLIIDAIVTDDGEPNLSLEKNFTIDVLDVNEKPFAVTLLDNTQMEISEATLIDDVVGTIEVLDEDQLEHIQIHITTGDGLFKLSPSGVVCESARRTLHQAFNESVVVTVCTTALLLARVVDYESQTGPVTVSVEVQDKGALTVHNTWKFTVTNANEPPMDILLDTELDMISENKEDVVVGTLSTVDDDIWDTHTYHIITYWDTFTILADRLIVKVPLDYEMHKQYLVSIRSTDNGTTAMSYTKEFTINVKNVNEAPSLILLTHTEVEVNSEADYTVGHLIVTDPDNTMDVIVIQTHNCTLTPPDLFAVVGVDEVQIKFTLPLDAVGFNVTITCTDSGVPPMSSSQDFYINVVESVNAPKDIILTATDGSSDVIVEENLGDISLGEFLVINILTKQADAGSFLYMLDDPTLTTVKIEGSTLILVEPLDYETTPKLTIIADAMGMDAAGHIVNVNQTFTVKVTDINEPPTDVGIYGGGVVTENSPPGSIVGDLYTQDPEPYQTYIYTLLGVSYGFEATEANTEMLGVFMMINRTLTVGPEAVYLNHETSDVITVLVRTIDSGTPPYSIDSLIHLQILDVNDPPTDIKLSNSMIEENSAVGSEVGVFTVVDEDVDQGHACRILNIIDVPFKITDDVNLAVSVDQLDFESQQVYNVEVTCGDTVSDGTRLHFTKTFTINITNMNEPPSNISMTSVQIQENNIVGQIIGEIQAVDLDSQTITYSLVGDESTTLFHIDGDSTLSADIEFDYETTKFHQVTIKATDEEGAFDERSFEIEVLDVNEAPTEIQLSDDTVSERARPGDIVGRLTTLDPDGIQTFTYTLDTNTTQHGVFSVKDSNLVVGLSGLDYEKYSEHKVTVVSTDAGQPPQSVQVDFTIHVTDSNEPPVGIILGELIELLEDTDAHTVIMILQVDDPDEHQKHSCQTDMPASLISIQAVDQEKFELVLLGKLNYEEVSEITLEITCTDGEFDVSKTLVLMVVDVNEAPTNIKLSGSNTIVADATTGHVIGEITVVDDDIGQSHTLTILGQNSDILKVNDKSQLTLTASIPRQQFNKPDPSLTFTMMAADNGDPVMTFNQTFVLPFTNIDIIKDDLPTITIDNVDIDGSETVDTVIGKLYNTNNTLGDNIRFSIVKNFENVFKIVDNTFLALQRDIKDIETSSVQLTIKVEDIQSFESNTKTITLFIQRNGTCGEGTTVCSNTETCLTNTTQATCQCKSDYERDIQQQCSLVDNCKSSVDTRSDVLCENDGVCVDDVNSFVCTCKTGFKGERCEIKENEVNPCSLKPCKNEGICLPNIESDSYTCSCKTGWTGTLCDVTIDDCLDSTCYQGGTCIDKHLTYLCTCADGRKGLRCEYGSDVCAQKYCNSTHVCAGLALETLTLCVNEREYVVTLTYKPVDGSDIQAFQARLSTFIIRNGRLPSLTSPSLRKKRAVTIEEAQVYPIEVTQNESGEYIYSFVVINENGDPLTRDTVLNTLSTTCKSINAGDLTEDTFCPSILAAVGKPPPEVATPSSVGLIVGIIVGVLVVVVLIVVVIIIMKKKNTANAVKPEETEVDTESGISGSRRSSGYSSISKPSHARPLPSNKVCPSPVPTIEDTDGSSTQVEAINY